METWYRKISRDKIDIQGYLPKFTVEEREEPRPQPVTSPIIDTDDEEQSERTDRTEETSTTSTRTTSPTSTSTRTFKNKEEFKRTMLPIYEKVLSKMGLDTAYAKMLVAQDGLESGWGRSAQGRFNYGNITLGSNKNRSYTLGNDKDKDGNPITQKFVNYDSLEDYAQAKVQLLNSSRYKAFNGPLQEFANRVYQGGYATAPNYVEALNRVIASAKNGGILKFQAGGTGEIKPDNRSWLRKQWDNLATKYNSSQWAESAPAAVLAGFTPFGLWHYTTAGDEDSARLAVLPGAVGTKEVAKDALQAAKEGVDLVYKHYGDNLAKYFQGTIRWLKNAKKGTIPIEERLQVPKQITKIKLGNPKHDYAFYKDAKTGETILEINPNAKHPTQAGEKAASKQLLQELVGTKDDFGLRGLSFEERELFPKKFLSTMTQENTAKDIYAKIMSYKAEAGIKSSFTNLTEAEAKQIFDIGWDANMFYPTNSMNALQNRETFWKENKDIIVKLFRRVPAILGAGVLGNEVISEKNGGIFKAQKGADTKQWVDSWLSQRKDKLKNNAIDTGILALPGILRNPYFRQIKSLNKYTFKEGDLPKDITGITRHKEKTITVSDGKKDTEVHEWTHATRPYEQIAKVKEIIDTWGLKPGIVKDDYLDNPSEIYSRLMEFRYNNNLDPNHEYTLKEVQELRKKNHSGDYLIRTKNQHYQSNINNPTIPDKDEPIENLIDMNLYKGSEDILERYSDSAIQRLLNDVAQVSNKSTVIYAQDGVKIPDAWIKVLPEQLRPQTVDPNWKSPLLETQIKSTNNNLQFDITSKKYQIPFSKEQIDFANKELTEILDPNIFWDLIYSENKDFGLNNISATGARGLTQFTKSTAIELLGKDVWNEYLNGTRTFEEQIQDIKKLYTRIKRNWKYKPDWQTFGRWKVNLLAPYSSLKSVISNRVWNTSLSDNIKSHLTKGVSTYEDLANAYDNLKLYN